MEMSERDVVRAILRMVEVGYEGIRRDVTVRRPYVMVQLYQKTTEDAITGIGFSKVCYPDKWNVGTGINIATAKAAQDLAGRLLND